MSVTLIDDEEPTPGLDVDGRPDPAYAAALGLIPASLGKRALAFVIDAAIAVVLALPAFIGGLILASILLPLGGDPTTVLGHGMLKGPFIAFAVGYGAVTIFLFVQLLVHGLKGLTVGKLALGLRDVNVARFGKPGFWHIVLRDLVLVAAYTIVPYLGAIPFLLSPLWDPEKRGRGWHDRIGKNWLIDVRSGLNPFDAKLLRHAHKAASAPPPAPVVEMPSLATGGTTAEPSFVPSSRSSSGVISTYHDSAEAENWVPPLVGDGPAAPAPMEQPAPPPVAQPAAVPPPVAQPAAVPPPAPQAAAAGTPVSSAATSTVLLFDNGERLVVRGEGLIGRNPQAAADDHPEHLVLLKGEELSKTHLQFGVDAAGFWVLDRESRNGTRVTAPAGASILLAPRQKTLLAPGSRVDLGGNSFTVLAEA